MVRMTKKRRAFQLFDKGKGPHDPEVEALGLSRKLGNRYFRQWRQLQGVSIAPSPVAPSEVATVPVKDIPMGGKFEYNGKLYRKVNAVFGVVIGLRLIEQDNQMFLSSSERIELHPAARVILK